MEQLVRHQAPAGLLQSGALRVIHRPCHLHPDALEGHGAPHINPEVDMKDLDSTSYDTDKGASYLKHYSDFFSGYRDKPVAIMELGVNRGGSLLMWRDYFEQGTVVGIDLDPPAVPSRDRLFVFSGDATEASTFERVEAEAGIGAFDIIIDDASHVGDLTKKSFELLFESRLKPGGLYVLEDWGTSYLADWPDGEVLKGHREVKIWGGAHRVRFPSHDMGMAGYLKQLIDTTAAPDVLWGGGTVQQMPIHSITIMHGLAFIRKAVDFVPFSKTRANT